MQNFDVCAKFGLRMELYAASLSDNTAYTIPVGIVSAGVKPVGLMIVDAQYPGGLGALIVSYAMTVSNGAPIITPQFIGDIGTINCQIAVFWEG